MIFAELIKTGGLGRGISIYKSADVVFISRSIVFGNFVRFEKVGI